MAPTSESCCRRTTSAVAWRSWAARRNEGTRGDRDRRPRTAAGRLRDHEPGRVPARRLGAGGLPGRYQRLPAVIHGQARQALRPLRGTPRFGALLSLPPPPPLSLLSPPPP